MQHLSEILEQAVANHAHCTAVEDPGFEEVTYAGLWERCQRLQQTLVELGVGPGERIGILLPKSIESVVAILGTLAAGAAYVPVDIHAPANRSAYIIQDCRAKVVLLPPTMLLAFLEAFPFAVTTHTIDGLSCQLLLPDYTEPGPQEVLNIPADLAYVLYTSGSTGKPKGVMITHQNALSFVEWSAGHFDLTDRDVFTSIAPFHFDLSVFDLYVAFLKGAKLVLFDQKASKNPLLIARLMAEKRVSVMYATPTLLRLILQYGKPERFDHSHLRVLLFAGEVFPIEPLRKLKSLWHQARFYNLYGPTETNVVTWYELPPRIADQQNQPFPIGYACAFAECKLWLDKLVEPVPGARGELMVSGESVAAGYLNLPAKNRSAFYSVGGQRWYKTGDIVEVNEKQEFVFTGRNDRMVKRNGYRIELGEIETALDNHPDIEACAVVAHETAGSVVRITAFVKVTRQAKEINAFQLKQYCQHQLLAYMIPDQFQFLQNFPQTSTHKMDYQRLAQLVGS